MIRGLSIDNVPVVAGWIASIALSLLFAAGTLLALPRARSPRPAAPAPQPGRSSRSSVFGVILLGLTAVLNANRSPEPRPSRSPASPTVLPVVVVLLIFWTFVLDRTRFGRHLYAVGGNAEAARRAGINVTGLKVTAFMICSTMAAVSGIVQPSYTGKVSTGSGGGNTLLYAVGAAVIGGTSLFGGKGRALDAVLGGLVIATIANGLGLLNQASYINYLVTGGVLLLAAVVDAISRRRRSAAGI